MPKQRVQDDITGVPVRTGDPVHDYPDGIPVALPPGLEDAPRRPARRRRPKSGQKAATEKQEN